MLYVVHTKKSASSRYESILPYSKKKKKTRSTINGSKNTSYTKERHSDQKCTKMHEYRLESKL